MLDPVERQAVEDALRHTIGLEKALRKLLVDWRRPAPQKEKAEKPTS